MNFFNSSKPKAPAVSPRSDDLICRRNHGGIISAIATKNTLIKVVSWLMLTPVISSCTVPFGQMFDPRKPNTGKSSSGAPIANFRPNPEDVVQPMLLPAIGKLSSPITSFQPKPENVVQLRLLPAIGKWMLDPDLTPAHWIGEVYYGKDLREPINIIMVDQVANSPEEAKRRLIEACSTAGYPSREGRSSGYLGYIGGQLQTQLPAGQDHAFSNAPFIINNDHGRIFEPYSYKGAYLFIGAFSREKVTPLATIKHEFVSFDQARDDFADNISRKTQYQVSGYVNLDNVIVADPKITTGDHDGIAVLLKAGK